MENKVSKTEERGVLENQSPTRQPCLPTYRTYTCKYLLNWELKKFCPEMANMGHFFFLTLTFILEYR